MGRYDLRPARVRQAADMLLAQRRITHEPAWFQAVSDYPPTTSVVRTLPVRHEESHNPSGFSKLPASSPNAPNSRRARRPKKPSKLFAPLPIRYEEDDLRTEFFSDHPWELARPRPMLEDDGKDYQRWDWSKAHQAGRPVSGESVIQRQLHLQHVDGLAKQTAYDQARREHYEARHAAEVERRIAHEEASAVDARFGATANQIGMHLENQVFDRWKVWAEAKVVAAEHAKAAAYGGTGGGEDEPAGTNSEGSEGPTSGTGTAAGEAQSSSR